MGSAVDIGRAEQAFRSAFERLKQGKPALVGKGAKVTQNNVAKEAGVDPSALKKKRFPILVAEIQSWIAEQASVQDSGTVDRSRLGVRSARRGLRERLTAAEAQRDKALSLLVDAEARVLELHIENERLRSYLPPSNVTPLRG